MGKASEIWKEIKPKVGEMLMAVNDIETQAEKAQEEAYQRGLNDAKEGKATCQYCEYQYLDDTEEPCKRCCKAYMNKFKPKAKEEQIQVGDEVKWNGDEFDSVFVVTHISEDGYISGINSEEMRYDRRNPENWTKTGRRFPELVEVLAKMKEEQP